MKIISNFNDFYDSIVKYGIDEKIVYKRVYKSSNSFDLSAKANEKKFIDNIFLEEDSKKYNLNDIVYTTFKNKSIISNFFTMGSTSQNFRNNGHHNYNLYLNVAIINSKLYKVFLITNKNNDIELKTSNVEEVFSFIKSEKFKNGITNKYLLGYLKDIEKIDFKDYIKKNNINYNYYINTYKTISEEQLTKMHKEYSSPILVISSNPINRNSVLYKDVSLKYFGFSNSFENIEQLTQEISYCLANVIQNKNEPPEKISDIVRLEQHGFDKYSSFRNVK